MFVLMGLAYFTEHNVLGCFAYVYMCVRQRDGGDREREGKSN